MKGSRSVKTTAKQTVKKAAATAKKAAEPVVEATEAAVPVVEETVKTVAKVAEKAVSKAEEVKDEVKKEVKKTAAKRTRTAAVKESVYLQYLGKELNSADIVERAKKASGVETITSITVYLKPEENKAYYVVNGDVTGSVEL